jgi:hypothetical protein
MATLAHGALEEGERRPLRVAQDRESATRVILRRYDFLGAGLQRLLEGAIDIVDVEVHRPVARDRRRDLGVHLEGARDLLAIELELRVRRDVALSLGRLVGPSEDLL